MNNGNYIVNNEWLLDLIQFSIKFQSEGALWILETIKNEKSFLPKSKE